MQDLVLSHTCLFEELLDIHTKIQVLEGGWLAAENRCRISSNSSIARSRRIWEDACNPMKPTCKRANLKSDWLLSSTRP